MKVEHTSKPTEHAWHAQQKTTLVFDGIAGTESNMCRKKCGGDKWFKRHENQISYTLICNSRNNIHW